MKKVTIYILLFCCMLSFMPCHAEGPAESVEQAREQLQRLNIINEDSFSQEEIVYRCEAIVPIMKMIGLPEDVAKKGGPAFISPPFVDITMDEWNNEDSPKNQYGITVDYYNYVIIGYLMWIVWGYRGNFSPYDAITAKEAATFMMRAIEDLLVLGSLDTEITYTNAKACGLIQPEDRFYEDGDLALTRDELCILLDRMLYQPCCICYRQTEIDPGPWYDEARTKRYIDILNGDFPESGDQSLW